MCLCCLSSHFANDKTKLAANLRSSYLHTKMCEKFLNMLHCLNNSSWYKNQLKYYLINDILLCVLKLENVT